MQTKIKSYPLRISGMGCVKINRSVKENQSDSNLFEVVGTATFEAAKEALNNAKIQSDELDMIINYSVSYEKMMPEPATVLQKFLNLNDMGIPCFTIHSSDIGFISALDICSAFFENGRFNTIMIVSAEVLSTMVNNKENGAGNICFSDVATAAIITRKNATDSVVFDALIKTKTSPECYKALFSMWQFQREIPYVDRCIAINAKKFEKHSFELISKIQIEYSEMCGLDDVKTVIFPNFFKKSTSSLFSNMGNCNVINNVAETGYHGSSSILAELYKADRSGKVERGDTLLLVGVGSGIEAGMIKIVY